MSFHCRLGIAAACREERLLAPDQWGARRFELREHGLVELGYLAGASPSEYEVRQGRKSYRLR